MPKTVAYQLWDVWVVTDLPKTQPVHLRTWPLLPSQHSCRNEMKACMWICRAVPGKYNLNDYFGIEKHPINYIVWIMLTI